MKGKTKFKIRGSVVFDELVYAKTREEAKVKFLHQVETQLNELIRNGIDVDTVLDDIKPVRGD